MAVTEWAFRVSDEPTVTVAAVRCSLSGVTGGAGAAAAVHTAGGRGDSPALAKRLWGGGLFPISHLHVVCWVVVVIATKTFHGAHVRTWNDDKHHTVPVVINLHSKVSVYDSKKAASVKMESIIVQRHREVRELTIDLNEIEKGS